ncbi:MAG: response regulator transcription factor [Actinomycetota bacterium]
MTIEVLIADDQEMVRTGLQQMIDSEPDLAVIGVAKDGQHALDLARELKPDVCVLDVRMPRLTGLEVTRHLAADPDPPAIVIVTTYDLEEYLVQALQAGASGFVLKDAPADVLTGAIHSAVAGDTLISPRLTHRLIDTYLQRPRHSKALNRFTDKEQAVLRSVCAGLTNEQIAGRHHISLSTAKGHIRSLMQKTGADNRVKLVIWAYTNTDINPDGGTEPGPG